MKTSNNMTFSVNVLKRADVQANTFTFDNREELEIFKEELTTCGIAFETKIMILDIK